VRYVYAIRAAGALPDLRGLGDAPVEQVRVEDVAAVCSASPRPPEPDAPRLWRHQEVVETLMRYGPVLPVRFGTRLADDEEIRTLVRRHLPALVAGLAAVRDKVEVGVRVLWAQAPPSQPPVEAGTGRDYLLRRAAHQHAEDAWRLAAERRADDLHGALAVFASAATRTVLPAPNTLMAGAYLVDAEQVDRIGVAARALGEREADLTFVPTGPWPPYSFAPALQGREVDRVG
jgi:hypothetical protein